MIYILEMAEIIFGVEFLTSYHYFQMQIQSLKAIMNFVLKRIAHVSQHSACCCFMFAFVFNRKNKPNEIKFGEINKEMETSKTKQPFHFWLRSFDHV